MRGRALLCGQLRCKSSYPHFTVVLLLDIPKSPGTAHEPTAHRAVGCPACGVAVLSRVALTDFSTALERALKNRSAAPASLPCFRHWRRSAPLQVLLSALHGSPPGRRSYRPRNRGLTKAPLGLWLRHKCRRPVQVLLSAVECFQKDYCKRKETAFFESCL